MKFIAYLLVAVVFISAMIMPITELLSAFSDMCKIDAAVHSSMRAAIKESENEDETRNVESVIIQDKFEKVFRDSFCSALNLKTVDSRNFTSVDGKYNDFSVKYFTFNKNKCTVEVKTPYKFKSGLFNRYLKDLNSAGDLRVKKTITFIIEN